MPKLTAAQSAALDIINRDGALYAGNKVSIKTVRVLERLGLATVEAKVAWTNPTMNARARGAYPKPYLDWVAKRVEAPAGEATAEQPAQDAQADRDMGTIHDRVVKVASAAPADQVKAAYLAALAAIDTPNARARAARTRKAERLLAELLGDLFEKRRYLAAYVRALDGVIYGDDEPTQDAQADHTPDPAAATSEWATEESTEELDACEARAMHTLQIGGYRAKVVEFTWDTGARLLIWHEDHGRVPLADDDADGFGVRFDSLDEAQDAAGATLYDLVPM